jgi:hypothetical protein
VAALFSVSEGMAMGECYKEQIISCGKKYYLVKTYARTTAPVTTPGGRVLVICGNGNRRAL